MFKTKQEVDLRVRSILQKHPEAESDLNLMFSKWYLKVEDLKTSKKLCVLYLKANPQSEPGCLLKRQIAEAEKQDRWNKKHNPVPLSTGKVAVTDGSSSASSAATTNSAGRSFEQKQVADLEDYEAEKQSHLRRTQTIIKGIVYDLLEKFPHDMQEEMCEKLMEDHQGEGGVEVAIDAVISGLRRHLEKKFGIVIQTPSAGQ